MADKSFGVKELNLLNASGTPTVTSPNNLNLNANTVAISTSCTIGNNLDVDGTTNLDNVDIVGITTIRNASGTKLYEGVANGSKLFHAGTERLSTELYGIDINGTLGADQINCSGIVTASSFSGSGVNLTCIAVTEAPVTDYTITANGSSAYRFAGGGVNSSSNNPDLYLVRGQKYRFNNTTGSSHPFAFRDSANGADYTSGISGSQNGIQFFTVPLDAPALLKYRCTIHTSNMVGNIYIRGAGGQETNVGFTTFSNKIEVQSSSNTTATFKGSGGAGFINITDGDDGTLAFLGVDGGTFKIQTSGGSYSDKLTVAPDGTSTFKNTSGGTLKVGGSSAHTSKIVIADNGGTANGNCLIEGGDGTDFFTIQSNGNVAFENGKGINFGATAGSGATSSIFDDYEEGTWTVGIDSRLVTGSEGHYTKIGRLVVCQFILNGLNASTTGANISGLPYTSKNSNQIGLCNIGDVSGVSYSSGSSDIYGRVNANATNVQLLSKTTSGASHSSTAFTLNTNVVLRGYIMYMTA